MSASGIFGDDYVPMRDLFTSPAVSYAYERGWRQGFAQAGFPGPDQEAKLAMEYFAPTNGVLVDMSCDTGLFTRRFAKSGNYCRVLGCDYSDSMLVEARKRIQDDTELSSVSPTRNKSTQTQLDLIRLDVGRIPMQSNSVDAIHAGAAMHCWPDLPAAVQEIYRVLKPGGRYFATTFLSSYFRILQGTSGGASGSSAAAPSSQAFQYFGSIDVLRDLLVKEGGFANEKVFIEVLGNACVVIRAEK
jgi:ubiquinone/menaquinone biosynthesis C-methylase UbiE